MSDQSQVAEEEMDVQEAEVQTKKIIVRPLDPNKSGFRKKYRGLLAAQRAFMNPEKAIPEDVDSATEILASHFIEPSNPFEIEQIIDDASQEELMDLFNKLLGMNTVPPKNGAA